MSYTTTSVRRSVVMVKVKTTDSTRKPPKTAPLTIPVPSPVTASQEGGDAGINLSNASPKEAVPVLFNRSLPPKTRPVAPDPSDLTWPLLFGVISFASLSLAIYFFVGQAVQPERPRPASIEPSSTNVLPLLNLRPSRLSARQTPGNLTRMETGRASQRVDMSSLNVDGHAQETMTAIIYQAALDGSSKLELPANVAGVCDIGEGAIRDFGACLARNGARVK